MAKAVFRPGEAKEKEEKFVLSLMKDYAPEVEEVEEVVEEYTGPSVEDIKREVESERQKWELEKQQIISQAQAQANEIIKSAENTAFEEIKRQTDDAQIIKADAENYAQEILTKARAEAQEILNEAELQKNKIEQDAKEQGFEQGHSEGYEKGADEAKRLVERMHKMIEAVMQRRQEILTETESQIVELVILMARKVIKILSDNQKNVVMANTLSALKKVRTRGEVTLRVNLEDIKLTTAHINEFIQHVENVKGITVLEDSTVEKGGCVVETDFGSIDARISSQLTELENKILEISPLKSIKRSAPNVEE